MHVVKGLPIELEVYKEDGSLVQKMPDAVTFSVFAPLKAPSGQSDLPGDSRTS
jgi:hypothetical protein